MEERVRSVQEKLSESSADSLDWKEKFETLERDSSPASKEYLKNLVLQALWVKISRKIFQKNFSKNEILPYLQYLAVSDKSKKLSMQMALMTILELTMDDIK